MTTPADTFYYHTDGPGSVTNVTDSNGDKQWKYSYDPFGDERMNRQISTTAPENPMRYTGEHLDNFTDTYHLRARQYDAHLGRFTQTDPKAPAADAPYISSYAYAQNQPTVFSDPSGKTVVAGCLGASAGLGIVVSAEVCLGVGDGPSIGIWGTAGIGIGGGISFGPSVLLSGLTLFVICVD